MKNSKLFKNSSFSVLQTVATAIAALVLFKLMVVYAGLKITGIWSFLTSINAIASFGSYGFANALLFYIPKYKLEENDKKLNSLINTTLLLSFFFTALLCAISYFIFTLIIPGTVDIKSTAIAFTLLPLIVVSFFFSGLSLSYLSILDGLILMHIRAKINIAGSAVFLTGGFILLLRFGIIGIAIAQIIQNIFLFVASMWQVKKYLPGYNFSFDFNKNIFKSIFRYGFNFQIISVTQIVSEPFMKAMITKFAGSENTAIFDFCVKLLSVFRSLIIAANQTIIPQITIFKTKGNLQRINVYYKTNFKLVLFLSILFFLSPIVLTDTISMFFLSRHSGEFNFILINVSVAFFINALAFPAYFHNLGTGHLKWNVINNIVAALLILIFTPLLGKLIGGNYVIICWALSAITGSVILITAFNRENRISLFSFFNFNMIQILAVMAASFIVCRYLDQIAPFRNSLYFTTSINLIVLILFLFYPVVKNSTFKEIRRRIILLRKKNLEKA